MMEGDGTGGPTRAIRLTIAQKGSELRVVASQTVRMITPPSDPTYGQKAHAGFWFEVRDADQECVYRRVMPNPLRGDLEAPSGDPERPFTRVAPPADHETVFVLLVPEIANTQEVVLCASPAGKPGERARAIAALDLRKPEGKLRMLVDEEPPKKTPTRGSRKSKKGGR
jgi:hypothetical protein